jgi:uncharacterized protein (TIGR02145 family)
VCNNHSNQLTYLCSVNNHSQSVSICSGEYNLINMKNLLKISGVILLLSLIHACEKMPESTGITTTNVTSISYTTATTGGDVNINGGAAIISRGVCWDRYADPTIDNSKTIEVGGEGTFTSQITLLSPNTLYYVRAYATNNSITEYGNQVSFTTSQDNVPFLETPEVILIDQESATIKVNITSDNGGAVTERGVCWGTSANPTLVNNKNNSGPGTGEFKSVLTGLTANTTYYVKAYATNSVGTAYSEEITFILLLNYPGQKVKDIDGNTYNSVNIGNQLWMVENLKTTQYNDGTPIPLVNNGLTWKNMTTPARCWYNNDEIKNKNTYGSLYNWFTVNTGKLCPTGWHVPSDSEWGTLELYTRMDPDVADLTGFRGTDQGDKLKNTSGWNAPDNGTNATGFSALPGGYINNSGEFVSLLINGNWWRSTGFYREYSYYRRLYYSESKVGRYDTSKVTGFSVRCLQD